MVSITFRNETNQDIRVKLSGRRGGGVITNVMSDNPTLEHNDKDLSFCVAKVPDFAYLTLRLYNLPFYDGDGNLNAIEFTINGQVIYIDSELWDNMRQDEIVKMLAEEHGLAIYLSYDNLGCHPLYRLQNLTNDLMYVSMRNLFLDPREGLNNYGTVALIPQPNRSIVLSDEDYHQDGTYDKASLVLGAKSNQTFVSPWLIFPYINQQDGDYQTNYTVLHQVCDNDDAVEYNFLVDGVDICGGPISFSDLDDPLPAIGVLMTAFEEVGIDSNIQHWWESHTTIGLHLTTMVTQVFKRVTIIQNYPGGLHEYDRILGEISVENQNTQFLRHDSDSTRIVEFYLYDPIDLE